jgi:glycosyltransferase involved in cell wall biosynthesis
LIEGGPVPRQVAIQWEISSYSGWGVYGLNLALSWSGDAELEPMTSVPFKPELLRLDALRRSALQDFLSNSHRLQSSLQSWAGQAANAKFPVLAGATSRFTLAPAAHDVAFAGSPTVAIAFFETPALAPDVVERARDFPLVVTGSTWNEQVLRAHGVENVRTVLQGVDPALFHPGPRADVLRGKFLVFSGGKLELRKGQDIVLSAFRAFAASHTDAVLVTAWHSPWANVARSLDQTGLAPPVIMAEAGYVDVKAWAAAAGIPADQVIDLGAVPNFDLAPLLREMDVALFPNRAEGGTNLVAMECMACGVPVILSRNTGHLDLIQTGNAYVLADQRPFPGHEGPGGGGWGESSIEEAVALLEQAYTDRDEARRRGLRGAETVGALTWARTAGEMKGIVLSLGG